MVWFLAGRTTQKRVASLNQVMKDIARHRRLEQELIGAEHTNVGGRTNEHPEVAARSEAMDGHLGRIFDMSIPKQADEQSPYPQGGGTHSPRRIGTHSPRHNAGHSPRSSSSHSPKQSQVHSPRDSGAASPRQSDRRGPREGTSHSPGSTSPGSQSTRHGAGQLGILITKQYPAHSPRQAGAESPRNLGLHS